MEESKKNVNRLREPPARCIERYNPWLLPGLFTQCSRASLTFSDNQPSLLVVEFMASTYFNFRLLQIKRHDYIYFKFIKILKRKYSVSA